MTALHVVRSLLCLCMLLPGLAAAVPAAPASGLLILHNSFVSAEKFQLLQSYAAEAGLALEHLNVDNSPPLTLQNAIEASSLVLLDVPRPGDRAQVTARSESLVEQLPHLIIGGGPPTWSGLPAPEAAALVALYSAGGEENFRRFLTLSQQLQQGTPITPALLAAPQRLPSTGFYHPQAPAVFATQEAYLSWQATRAGRVDGHVAFLVHSGVVSDMLTRDIDELIARTEAVGLMPMVFWFDDATQPDGLPGVFARQAPDVLVNLTHMQNGSARSKDFLTLDVPVIQTLRFREGDAATWPQADSGIAAGTTAIFLAGPEGWGISDPLVLSATTAGVDNLLPAQADALIAKVRSLVTLRRTPAADKRLALLFWNYPAGEKNLGASHLNVPRSIVALQQALLAEGYALGEPVTETQVIDNAQPSRGGPGCPLSAGRLPALARQPAGAPPR